MKKTFYYLFVMFCINLFACNSNNTKQWEEVSAFGEIKPGEIFKLIPLKDSILSLSGEFSDINIDFKCIAMQSTDDLNYKSATSIQTSGSSNTISVETTESGNFNTWPVELKEQNIKIPVINFSPFGGKYEGKGQ